MATVVFPISCNQKNTSGAGGFDVFVRLLKTAALTPPWFTEILEVNLDDFNRSEQTAEPV